MSEHRRPSSDYPRSIRGAVALAAAIVCLGSPMMADDAGLALRFDGASDFVRLPATSLIMVPGWQATKTISLWVKPTGSAFCTVPSPTHCDAVFGDRPRWWGISRGTIGGADRLWIWNWDGNLDTIGIEYTPGEWVHVALVHDADVLSVYKNGVLAGSTPSGPTQQPSSGALPLLHVGGIINNSSRNWTFEGEIDELRLWNYARGGAEIFADMSRELTGAETGLAAYYRMSDGGGSQLTDDSGHVWTGELVDGGNGVPADGPILWVASGAFGGGGGPPGNTAPVAHDQDVGAMEDTPVPIVLTGADADGDALTFQVTSAPAHGSLSGVAPMLMYTPAPDYNGGDGFTFVVNDGNVNSLPAVVTLTVAPGNDPPMAVDDAAATVAETAVVVTVLANDVDVDGDALTVTGVGLAAGGTTSHDGTLVTYEPAPGFTGVDVFSYTIEDPFGAASAASVSVTVAASGALVELGSIGMSGNANDLVVVNGLAYVAALSGGLRIFDVSNPTAPAAVSSLPTTGGAHGVFVAGSHAYVANGANGLLIVDVSNPLAPVLVAVWNTPGFATDVEVAGSLAFVADRSGGLTILDVSNPGTPVELAVHLTPDQALDVAVSGTVAYVAAYGAGIRVIDVADPANPVEIGSFQPPHLTYGVVVAGPVVYAAVGASGLQVVDVSDPALPQGIGELDTPGFSRSISVDGSRLVVADWTAGIRLVDVSVPGIPVELDDYLTPGRSRDAVIIGRYIYVADYQGGLRIFTY